MLIWLINLNLWLDGPVVYDYISIHMNGKAKCVIYEVNFILYWSDF